MIQSKWFNKTFQKKISLGVILASFVGLAFYYFIGCKSGTCGITSSPVNSTLYGVIVGVLWTFPTKRKRNV